MISAARERCSRTALMDIYGGADSHQIAGLVFGKNLVDNLYHLVHLIYRFAYGQTADCISIRSFGGDEFSGLLTQILINTSLHDGEERLVVAVFRFSFVKTLNTTIKPSVCQP